MKNCEIFGGSRSQSACKVAAAVSTDFRRGDGIPSSAAFAKDSVCALTSVDGVVDSPQDCTITSQLTIKFLN